MNLRITKLGTEELIVERSSGSKWLSISDTYHTKIEDAKKELEQFVLRGPRFYETIYEVNENEIKRPKRNTRRVSSKPADSGADEADGNK